MSAQEVKTSPSKGLEGLQEYLHEVEKEILQVRARARAGVVQRFVRERKAGRDPRLIHSLVRRSPCKGPCCGSSLSRWECHPRQSLMNR
jgi:hypothetical protein